MTHYYTADSAPLALPATLPAPFSQRALRYLPEPGLVDAVNLSILLGQPLLLTGEAGTGKTRLAYHLAQQLQLGEPLKFETKSSSVARDLFYVYDYLPHFQSAQTRQGSSDVRDYLHYHALGEAILRTRSAADIAPWVSADFAPAAPRRSVVLIDEIDKAPRDFPNDLLNEVEGLYFRVPELGNVKIAADPALRPLLVLTSNSEKHLPAAFLRRCVYYHLPFPSAERLAEIVAMQLPELADASEFVQQAITEFNRLRSAEYDLQKKPATAELLAWLDALRRFYPDSANPLAEADAYPRTLPVLLKNSEDRQRVAQLRR